MRKEGTDKGIMYHNRKSSNGLISTRDSDRWKNFQPLNVVSFKCITRKWNNHWTALTFVAQQNFKSTVTTQEFWNGQGVVMLKNQPTRQQ